jgi:subtilisin family serine protease
MPIKASSDDGRMSAARLAQGINWAVQNGADVISVSHSPYDENPALVDAINNAVANGRNGKGCILVFSAGIGCRINLRQRITFGGSLCSIRMIR